jgi:hypothetical protein
MTYFLNFRTQDVGGPVVSPYLLEGDGKTQPPSLSVVDPTQVASIVTGKDLLFATHGFNVSYHDGACQLDTLGQYLALPPSAVFIGMLWPGDCWLPVVDYPFEGDVSIDCGKRLAAFCNESCQGAISLSFVSHSLGARLVLEAVSGLAQPARSVCLTAGAINRDCLVSEYLAAARNAQNISVLSSVNDLVLKVASTVGDPISDLLHPDHAAFEAALGLLGPALPAPGNVKSPWQIPNAAGYGHHDYLPPSPAVPLPPPAGAPWPAVADFMKRAFLLQLQTWP